MINGYLFDLNNFTSNPVFNFDNYCARNQGWKTNRSEKNGCNKRVVGPRAQAPATERLWDQIPFQTFIFPVFLSLLPGRTPNCNDVSNLNMLL